MRHVCVEIQMLCINDLNQKLAVTLFLSLQPLSIAAVVGPWNRGLEYFFGPITGNESR